MQIVIDIPKEDYIKILNGNPSYADDFNLFYAIKNGTLLPKGQGVSLESLDEDAKETVSHLVECYEDGCFTNEERVMLAATAFHARLRYQLNKYMEYEHGTNEETSD